MNNKKLIKLLGDFKFTSLKKIFQTSMTIDNYFNLLQTSKNYRNINNNTLLGKLKRRQIDILKKKVVKFSQKVKIKNFDQ